MAAGGYGNAAAGPERSRSFKPLARSMVLSAAFARTRLDVIAFRPAIPYSRRWPPGQRIPSSSRSCSAQIAALQREFGRTRLTSNQPGRGSGSSAPSVAISHGLSTRSRRRSRHRVLWVLERAGTSPRGRPSRSRPGTRMLTAGGSRCDDRGAPVCPLLVWGSGAATLVALTQRALDLSTGGWSWRN